MQFDERRYRPLSTVDLFDEAFDLYKRNFVLFLGIVAIVIVPTTIVSDVYALRLVNGMAGRLTDGDVSAADVASYLSTLGDFVHLAATNLLVFYGVMLVPWTLTFLALTTAVSARYLGEPITLTKSYVSSYRKLIAGVVAALIFTVTLNCGAVIAAFGLAVPDIAPLLIFIGVLVELFTSVIFLAKYPLFMGAIVNEGLGPLKSLKRSAILTSGDSGRIVWTIICLSILMMTVSGAVEGVLELFTGGIVDSSLLVVPLLQDNRVVAEQIADGLTSMLLTPYLMIVLILMYFDQRIRKEGYDMEILADDLGYLPVSVADQTAFAPALATPKIPRAGRK